MTATMKGVFTYLAGAKGMKSKNEEYLDNLLQSLKRDSNSGIAKTTTDPNVSEKYNADLNGLISNSSANEDLEEIGDLLTKVDSGELLDEGMTKVLDSIEMPQDESLSKYTVGDEISEEYDYTPINNNNNYSIYIFFKIIIFMHKNNLINLILWSFD